MIVFCTLQKQITTPKTVLMIRTLPALLRGRSSTVRSCFPYYAYNSSCCSSFVAAMMCRNRASVVGDQSSDGKLSSATRDAALKEKTETRGTLPTCIGGHTRYSDASAHYLRQFDRALVSVSKREQNRQHSCVDACGEIVTVVQEAFRNIQSSNLPKPKPPSRFPVPTCFAAEVDQKEGGGCRSVVKACGGPKLIAQAVNQCAVQGLQKRGANSVNWSSTSPATTFSRGRGHGS